MRLEKHTLNVAHHMLPITTSKRTHNLNRGGGLTTRCTSLARALQAVLHSGFASDTGTAQFGCSRVNLQWFHRMIFKFY
jgi:hypothetical protein